MNQRLSLLTALAFGLGVFCPAQASLHRHSRTASVAEAPSAPSAPLQLSDFAVRRALSISGQNGVIQVTLPADAYPDITDAQLRDVRVFNARGEAMAFAWFQPAARARVDDRQTTAAIFPVRGPRPDPTLAQDVEVSVTTGRDGTVLSARNRQGLATSPNASEGELQALILDLGPDQPEESLRSLVFDAPTRTASNASEYRADLAVDVSTDLKQWDRVATASVLWLPGESSSLVQDRVDLPRPMSAHPRYARIQWLRGTPAVFPRILVLRRQTVEHIEPLEETILEPQAGPPLAPRDWVYSAPPALAAEQIRLQLPETNSVLPVAIGAYDRAPGQAPDLRIVTQNNFFRLMQSGQERTSGWVAVRPQAHPEWVVRPLRSQDLTLAQAPGLMLRWRAATLVFAAQGPGPFVLAMGAKAPGRADLDLGSVAPGFGPTELAALEIAKVGPVQREALTGSDHHAAPKSSPADLGSGDHRMLLWAVLVLGFGILSAMCWTLYRQVLAKGQTTSRTDPRNGS